MDDKYMPDRKKTTWLGKLRKALTASWGRQTWVVLVRASILLSLVSSVCTVGAMAKALMS